MEDLKFEIKRKFFHVFFVIYLFIYLLFFGLTNSKLTSMIPLAIIFLFFLVIEYFRINGHKIPLDFLWRKSESKKFGGEIYYMIGIILSLLFFDLDIAITSTLMLTFGDSFAAVIGKSLGKHKIKFSRKKVSLEGSISELIVNLIIGILLLQNWIVIFMAVTATFAEIFVSKLDDNLTIPLFAGIIGQILRILSGA